MWARQCQTRVLFRLIAASMIWRTVFLPQRTAKYRPPGSVTGSRAICFSIQSIRWVSRLLRFLAFAVVVAIAVIFLATEERAVRFEVLKFFRDHFLNRLHLIGRQDDVEDGEVTIKFDPQAFRVLLDFRHFSA
jgi:hypothetical protein